MNPETGSVETQKLQTKTLFNNSLALVEGWYDLGPSKSLRKQQARSFQILTHRVTVWRGLSGQLFAVDSVCLHMGADLGHGKVEEENLKCYFHHWKYSGDGELLDTHSKSPCKKLRTQAYPVREYLNRIWIYAGRTVRTPLIGPPGLDNKKIQALHLANVDLYVHHHVMIAGGIDLQHFYSVHQIQVDFQATFRNLGDSIYQWTIGGKFNARGWRGWLAKKLVGDRFSYTLRLGAGSQVAISYGERQQLHVLWGCVPTPEGPSRVRAFSVVEHRPGLWGKIEMAFFHILTLGLLIVLRDDDAKACPNMKFEVRNPMPEDKTVLQLIHSINQMPESNWTLKSDLC